MRDDQRRQIISSFAAHDRLVDKRVGAQQSLQVRGHHFLAIGNNEKLFFAAQDDQEAVFVELAEVSGAEAATFDAFAGPFSICPATLTTMWSAALAFAARCRP